MLTPSRHSIRRHFIKAILLGLLFGLGACASSTIEENHPLGQLPGQWSKYLSVGSISAALNVYDEEDELVATQNLSIDAETGDLHSPQFKLPIGASYRFIVTFSYQLTSKDLIPYAFADFTWLVDEFSEQITFSENDINYDANMADASVSADVSAGRLPHLDLDEDQWTNWEELRDKVNPKDAQSFPIPPIVTVTGQQDGTTNTATLTIVARDNAHVEDLKLLDPLCGVNILSDTQATNVDGSVTRTMVVRLDLLSVRDGQSSRGMLALANDGVTSAQNASGLLNFNVSGTASQPYFVFVEPGPDEEVEDAVPFKGVACSRYDLDPGHTRFLNPEIANFAFNSTRNSQTGDYDLESDSVDTTLLPDGLVTLQVELKDVTNKAGQGSGVFRVVNDNQIKIVSPVGRRWVFGNEQLAVTLKNQAANLVVIEGNGNFTLSSSTAGGAVGTLKVANLPEGSLVPLTFKAVLSDGSEIVRKVNFSVRNRPQIKTFIPGADPVYQGWKTKFSYKIVNVDPNAIFVEGQSSEAGGEKTCGIESSLPGIVSCEGTMPVLQTKSSGNETVDILAGRLPTADENCLNCIETQIYDLRSGGVLSNDLPDINVAIDGDDEAEAPERVGLPVNPVGRFYRLTLKNLRSDVEQDLGEKAGGESFTLAGLDPRTDYHAVLQTLSGPGGNVIGEIFKEVTTGDIGLVGWWRFNKDPNGPVCPGGSVNETVCDYSGKGNHGRSFGGVEFLTPGAEFLDGAFGFDGVDDYSTIDNSGSLNPDSITVFISFKANEKTGEQSLLDKRQSAAGSSYYLRIVSATSPLQLDWTVRGSNGVPNIVSVPSSITEGNYYRLIATFNHLTGLSSVFLNGLIVGEQNFGVLDRSVKSNSNLVFGNIYSIPVTTYNFTGFMDTISIYDRAFNSSDVISFLNIEN